MHTRYLILVYMILVANSPAAAQDANYDEAKVPPYTLPNALIFNDRTKVEDEKDWTDGRRGEILQLFKEHVYGTMPPAGDKRIRTEFVKQREIEIVIDPASGTNKKIKARLKEVKLLLGEDPQGPVATLLIFLPIDSPTACPVFLGYNFAGNHTVNAANEISINTVWNQDHSSSIPEESTRGTKSSRWPVGMILSQGFGLATVYYGDLDPDFDDGFENGVHPLYPELRDRPDNWASIGAWAWGLHRVMDYFETDDEIDHGKVALIGHSRLGKTSLWAGATDQRFSLVVSNNSGCGGAALARRRFGETVARINSSFPHWFCTRHKEYSGNEDAMPVDQHMLIALIAPRPVYIASAVEDQWADPKGEFLAAVEADAVYQLFAKPGLAAEKPELPPLDSPIGETIGYHIRSGKHDITPYDWQQYINFARRHFQLAD